MPSSYTSSLRLVLPVTGELQGAWGDTVNNGLTNLVDSSIAGTATVTMTDANYTLTSIDGATDEARRMFIVLTGTLTATRDVVCPTVSKLYFVRNSTNQSIVFKTSAGTGVTVPIGGSVALYCDGTNVVNALDVFPGIPISGSAKTTSYTLLTTDVGKTIEVGTGGSVTIPNSTFAAGDAVLVFNNTAGDITITCSTTTTYIAGTDTSVASVTLATRGLANILFISGTVCVLTGNIS